ncbi:hypothetical protein CCYA_CCYA15G4014 [Cyanidiococcus yangmingshanensis]|nr:hypothetical protein CCYA_CCYA15G4014 [Cyanidiococcus yangmingshanensis]
MAHGRQVQVDWTQTAVDAIQRLQQGFLWSFWRARETWASSSGVQSYVRRPAVRRLVALGDVHGDLNALKKCLRLADVINERDEWTGADTVVVQVGDIFDRGDAERAVLHFLDALDRLAHGSGGAVYRLLGNHEIMNVDLDFRYVTPGGFAEFRLRDRELAGRALEKAYRTLPPAYRQRVRALPPEKRARALALAPGCPTARLLAERGLLVLIIGGTLFVHGGLRPEHVAYGLERLNAETWAWMERCETSNVLVPPRAWRPGTGTRDPGERPCTTAAASADSPTAGVVPKPVFLQGSRSPIWMRSYSVPHLRSGSDACRELERTLRCAGVRRMVVGHTPQPLITGACRGRVWRVDTGMSAAYGGVTEVLEITKSHGVRIITDHGEVKAGHRLVP